MIAADFPPQGAAGRRIAHGMSVLDIMQSRHRRPQLRPATDGAPPAYRPPFSYEAHYRLQKRSGPDGGPTRIILLNMAVNELVYGQYLYHLGIGVVYENRKHETLKHNVRCA